MADRELRQHERDAASGDPEARARLLRQQCRANGHTWIHHKGGRFRCKVCGADAPGDPREEGAQTLYGGPSRRELLQHLRSLEPEELAD